ncbi:MAG TPA: hypothetical protein VJW55_05620, partial [Candidatus Angelobacter sp.]|nr:hypothetical protein [Candidatus Angelobacter sp.]
MPAKQVAQAKTAQEFKDYNAAYATSGGAAVEKAADDFAAKYPASELRVLIYEKALHDYQAETNQPKILATGEKVLKLDPENAIALVLTASVLSDGLNESNPDQQSVAEIRKNATHALNILDRNFSSVANVTPKQAEAYKKTLQAIAHSALGITALKLHDDAGAEKELKAAAAANTAQPDPFVWFHLSLAQDHQGKYKEALEAINRAAQYAKQDPHLAEMVRGEQEHLQTEPEFADYNAVNAMTGGAASEKAADDFAAKYPASKLRAFLYEKVMRDYQMENNQPKILASGEKVLQLDPDNTAALVLTASVLSDGLNDSSPDQQNVAEIRKNATHALQILDGNFLVANATPEQVEAYKKTLQSLAHSALGITALKLHDDAVAEKELKTAAAANPAQPDPFVWYHLSLAQDHQNKYSEALASVN